MKLSTAKAYALQLVTVIRNRLEHFSVANQHIRTAARFENYPPRVVLEFERRPGHDERFKELYDTGKPRLAVISDDDKRICAAFVAEVLELRPWMERDAGGQLRYEMKPDYQKFKSSQVAGNERGPKRRAESRSVMGGSPQG